MQTLNDDRHAMHDYFKAMDEKEKKMSETSNEIDKNFQEGKLVPLQLQAELSNYKSMLKCTRLIFDTFENANPEVLVQILKHHNQVGWLLFAAKPIEAEQMVDLPDIKVEAREAKTPSQRLRSRMWVYYTKIRDAKGHGFEQWYADCLNEIGNKYLDATPKEDE